MDIFDDVNSNKRLCCFGHILNLYVRALLSTEEESSSDYNSDLRWKSFLKLSKLYHFSKLVLRSLFLKAKWRKQESLGKMISVDNDTHWNSVEKMIKTVERSSVAIDRFI